MQKQTTRNKRKKVKEKKGSKGQNERKKERYIFFLFGNHSRGRPEGSHFNSYRRVGEGATPFPGFLHFTLDTYLILLSIKQGSIKYHF